MVNWLARVGASESSRGSAGSDDDAKANELALESIFDVRTLFNRGATVGVAVSETGLPPGKCTWSGAANGFSK